MIQAVTVVPQFDPNSSRYRCWLGGCCRITTCVKIIGILELIGVTIDLIGTIVTYSQSPTSGRRSDLIIGIVTFLVAVVIIGMLFYGMAKQKAIYLLPHLIMQIIGLVLLAVGVILFGLSASAAAAGAAANYKYTEEHYDATTVAVCVVILVLLLLVFLLEILFFINVLRCYRYLKEKTIYERMVIAAPPPAYPAVVSQEQLPTAPPMNGFQNQGYDFQYKGGPV